MNPSRIKWNRLDNAAKLFPTSSNRAETHVFRFSCELDEPVDHIILQAALEETARAFPIFGYVLRRGFFWYYLEESDLPPTVRPEQRHLCARLYRPRAKTLLYAVSYYGNTINLEVYHVLTDGTGATHFLRTLVMKYLARVHDLPEEHLGFETAHASMADDAFAHYGENAPMLRADRPVAHQLRGPKLSESRTGLIRGSMSVRALLDDAHAHGATMTAYLAAATIAAIGEDMPLRARKKPVILNIPVNLRNYFASDSVRNFFTPIYVTYDFGKRDGNFADILAVVTETFAHELDRDRLAGHFRSLLAFEEPLPIRIIPLPLKDIIIRAVYRKQANRYTAILSNIGIIRMPEAFMPYIRGIHVCTATNKLQACVCSFGDTLSISLTSCYADTAVHRRLFRRLRELDHDIVIETNLLDDDA